MGDKSSRKEMRRAECTQSLFEIRLCFVVGIGRPSALMLVRSAAALATMSENETGLSLESPEDFRVHG